jgi:hypothetical protein
VTRSLSLVFVAAAAAFAASTDPPPDSIEVLTLAEGTFFEASGATRVPGGEGLLFVDDGRPRHVLRATFAPGGRKIDRIEPIALDGTIADPEGITNDGTWVYVVGSQSRGGNKGADLVRFHFDPQRGTTSQLEALSGLPALLSTVPEIASARGKKRTELNIEGLAWDAGRKELLLGLRAPLSGEDALVVPLSLGPGPLARETVRVGAARRVPLGGRGIRSIEQAPEGGFLIVAGGVTGLGQFSLFSWDGSGAPRLLRDFPVALKPEGVVRLSVAGRPVTVLLGDSGHYAVLD